MEASVCVDHPGVVVTGTCARCGRFICPVCPKELGKDHQRWCRACAWREGVHEGAPQIGGWLIIFAIGLLLKLLGSSIAAFAFILDGRLFVPQMGYWIVTVLTNVLFFRRRRAAIPTLATALFVDFVLMQPMKPAHWGWTQESIVLGGLRILPAVAVVYLLLSPRAKRTFVLPGL